MQATLTRLLERAATRPDAGLRFLDRAEHARWLSWGDLQERALRVAGGLRAAGVRPGERVALVYPTSPGFFDAFFGTLLAGAVPVPLYPPLRLGRLTEYHERTARMLRAVDAVLILADRRIRRLLGRTVELARPRLGCRPADGLSLDESAVRPVEADPDHLALVQFSSGTTTEPKPVALTHRAVLSQVAILNGFWPDGPAVRHSGVSWLPLYHDMGLIGCVFPALERPAVLTLLRPEHFVSRPALWLRAISRFRATISPAPNFAYALCLDKVRDTELDGVDLSCWRVALNGAEPVAPSVLRRFRERFAAWGFPDESLTPVYGLSEAALAVTFSAIDRPFSSPRFDRERLARDGRAIVAATGVEIASVGRAVPGFDLQVRDADGRELAECYVGRIWIRGPSLMRGYLGQPEATERVVHAGWLDTGDRGFLHGGELYLTGREKDVLIIRGRNHSPEEVEHAVADVVGLRRGCAIAASRLEEGAAGETLLLLVERAVKARPDEVANLADACRDAVLAATGLLVDRVEVLEPGTLPRTSSGKLRRRDALERHVAGRLESPAPVNPLRITREMVRSGRAFARLKKDARVRG
jgi:acyl-CoA synthetase (AMP-forming)/AMP-acid ligase II